MTSIVIVTSIICCISFFCVMRYNLHMFQLNGYKNDEQLSWLKKNIKKQIVLSSLSFASVLIYFVYSIWSLFICIVVLLIIIRYYFFLKGVNTKKKLVYTMRVKRLIVTDVILSLAIIYFMNFVGGALKYGIVTQLIIILLQPIMMILANNVNVPIEKWVKNYYINDAKRILKQNNNIIVIGVTGSFGKTSVKFYLKTLLKEKYNVLVTPESYNTPMGVVKTIRESLKSTHDIFICEMGARRTGEIKEICDIVNPKHGIITAIGPQHLETFLSIENIVKTKFELEDALPAEGMLFLNGDNELICEKSKEYANTYLYSTGSHAGDFVACDITLSQRGTAFTVVSPQGDKCEFQTKLVGEHNVINILGAIAVANTLGIELKDLKIPVRRIQAVPHRMQLIERGNLTIIDDAFNSNPIGSRAAVETLRLFDGVRILITPGMVELGDEEEQYNYLFGTYAAKCCDYIFLVGRKRTEPIKNGIISEGFIEERCVVCDNLEEAMAKANVIISDKHKYILLENDLPDNY